MGDPSLFLSMSSSVESRGSKPVSPKKGSKAMSVDRGNVNRKGYSQVATTSFDDESAMVSVCVNYVCALKGWNIMPNAFPRIYVFIHTRTLPQHLFSSSCDGAEHFVVASLSTHMACACVRARACVAAGSRR